jgi:hypothetical protein
MPVFSRVCLGVFESRVLFERKFSRGTCTSAYELCEQYAPRSLMAQQTDELMRLLPRRPRTVRDASPSLTETCRAVQHATTLTVFGGDGSFQRLLIHSRGVKCFIESGESHQ